MQRSLKKPLPERRILIRKTEPNCHSREYCSSNYFSNVCDDELAHRHVDACKLQVILIFIAQSANFISWESRKFLKLGSQVTFLPFTEVEMLSKCYSICRWNNAFHEYCDIFHNRYVIEISMSRNCMVFRVKIRRCDLVQIHSSGFLGEILSVDFDCCIQFRTKLFS